MKDRPSARVLTALIKLRSKATDKSKADLHKGQMYAFCYGAHLRDLHKMALEYKGVKR